MELLEEYKRTNRAEREYINLLNNAKEDIERKSKFNRIVVLENEIQQEVQELINKKKLEEWQEEARKAVVESFFKVDKKLTYDEIRVSSTRIANELQAAKGEC